MVSLSRIILLIAIAFGIVFGIFLYRNIKSNGQNAIPTRIIPPKWHRAQPIHSSGPPFLYRLQSFLSIPECAHLIQLCNIAGFKPSMVVDESTGNNKEDTVRTSNSCMLSRAQSEIVRTIEERAATVYGVPIENIEPLQVVRYYPGQKFDAHHDWFRHIQTTEGQRYATILVYLNDDFDAGHTVFPKINVSAKPVTGDGMAWHNGYVDENGQCVCFDESLHQGTSTTSGIKHALNIWIRYDAFR